MSSVYSSKDWNKTFKPYEYIYINNFNINNIKCFKSYGIKTFEAYGEELNKVSIIFEEHNKYHDLYKKVDTSLKKMNVSINPPFSEKKYNTIDLNGMEVNPIALNIYLLRFLR